MELQIQSPCRAGETVRWRYGGATQEAALDEEGRVQLLVDCFVGTTTPVEVAFKDGTRAELPVETRDLEHVSKVALVWQGPADLELNAFEHASPPGGPGHVWSGARSTEEEAMKGDANGRGGAGFLGTSAKGSAAVDSLEVYTYVSSPRDAPGIVAFAVAASALKDEGAGCEAASGREVAFRLVMLTRGAGPIVTRGIAAVAGCDAAPGEAIRLETTQLPALRLGQR
jgi:hypothetical protein